jgi:hypothetical protein
MNETPSETRLSAAVIREVATREGVDPTELDGSLYEAINPDALDLLFNESEGSVVFEFYGYIVSVDSEGEVDLTAVSGE